MSSLPMKSRGQDSQRIVDTARLRESGPPDSNSQIRFMLPVGIESIDPNSDRLTPEKPIYINGFPGFRFDFRLCHGCM